MVEVALLPQCSKIFKNLELEFSQSCKCFNIYNSNQKWG